MAETESSSNTFMIVSARSGATVRTVMFAGFLIGSIGTVSVTTMPAASACPRRPQRRRTLDQRSAGGRDVVADDADLVLDPTGHLRHLDLVVGGARLVHDGEVGLEHL